MHVHAESTTHNKDERGLLLEKYTSHFIVRFACERELETEQRLQHIDLPAPPDIAVCRSRSPGLLNRGPGSPASPEHVLIPASSHQLVWSPNSMGVPGAPSAGWWLSLPHLVSNSSDLQLNRGSRGLLLLGGGFLYHILALTTLISNSLTSCLSPSYIIVQSPTQYLFSWLARPEYATSGVSGLARLIVIKRK